MKQPAISILLPTNRLNHQVFPRINNIKDGLAGNAYSDVCIFNDEFIPLISQCTNDVSHYLQLTLNALNEQTCKDFELIISHRYPKDAHDAVKAFGDIVDFHIKLVEEKPSIWHNLGNYGTLNNNINTAFIHSTGNLMWRLDDMTFFNENMVQELYDVWYKQQKCVTSRAIRNIVWEEKYLKENRIEQVKNNKIRYEVNGWAGIGKFMRFPNHSPLDRIACWGYSSTIPAEHFMAVNGQDEVFDGAVCGTDIDLGMRLLAIDSPERVVGDNVLYELDELPFGDLYEKEVREDNILRDICAIRRNNEDLLRGNEWKPTKRECKRYEQWHAAHRGQLDKHWDAFMDVPYIDLEKERRLKRLGTVIYENDV